MPTKLLHLWARMQLVTPTNVINRSFSNILAKGLNIYVDLKIVASADKEKKLSVRRLPTKNITFVGEVANHPVHKYNNLLLFGINE